MPIGRHGSTVGSTGEPASVTAAHACGVYETMYFGHRTLFQLVLSGVLDRFPGLKVVFTELGGGRLGARHRGGARRVLRRRRAWTGPSRGCSPARRSNSCSCVRARSCTGTATTARRCSRPTSRAATEIGTDRMMWGADFPHHEGTVPYTLAELRATLASVPEPDVRQLLGGTAAEVYGADLAFLQPIADRVGFTPAQVAQPLAPDEIPDDPNFRTFLGSRSLSAEAARSARPDPRRSLRPGTACRRAARASARRASSLPARCWERCSWCGPRSRRGARRSRPRWAPGRAHPSSRR